MKEELSNTNVVIIESISDKIPEWPYADQKEEAAVVKVLKTTNWWRNTGTEVKAFEKEFAKYHDCIGGISVTNGTVAIEIALKALEIGEGDEVIIPAFTFYSTVSAVLAVNAIPVIVDVLPDTYCIDPVQIEKAISNKTKAIIPVHMAGQVAEMYIINDIASRHNLYVIEDSAHAHGAVWKGRKAGSFSTCSTFSFQNAKLMTAGEGGIILSNNEELLNKIFLQSNCGRAESDTAYQHVLKGTNARLSEIQGAILRVQLSRLEEQINLREENYKYLGSLLEKIPGIGLQSISKDMDRHPHYMIMFYYDKHYFNGVPRDEFVQYIKKAGIPSNRSFESIHKLPVFEKLEANKWRVVGTQGEDGKLHCPNSERISNEAVCLSHNILLGNRELLESIAKYIEDFQKVKC